MKRWIAWIGVAIMVLTLSSCTACGGTMPPDNNNSNDGTTAVQRKLGMSSVSEVMLEGGDRATVTVTAAALVLDGAGKIADCAVDELEFSVRLEGGLPQEVDDLLSRWEMGDDDRAEATPTHKAWRDQVEAFCDYAEGKTPGFMTGLATTDGKSGEIEGCDLVITHFIRALGDAAKEAKAYSLAAGDDLELALTASRGSGSTPEKPQYDVEMAAVTVGKGDRITGCITDTLQAKLTVTEGIFASLAGGLETKRQMGNRYGMKAASGIGREWYEQADAFDTFAVGKTAEELAALRLGSDGKTDAISGCTVVVSGVLKNVVKAAD